MNTDEGYSNLAINGNKVVPVAVPVDNPTATSTIPFSYGQLSTDTQPLLEDAFKFQ